MTDSAQRPSQVSPERHRLKQASIPPVVSDGVLPFRIGLGIFSIAALLSLLPATPEWLRPISLAGVIVGAVGLIYCTQRREKIRAGKISDNQDG